MIRIGILGEIGAGKTYISKNFGYPVFNADYEVARFQLIKKKFQMQS
jgi:dephospho-CoA kinase